MKRLNLQLTDLSRMKQLLLVGTCWFVLLLCNSCANEPGQTETTTPSIKADTEKSLREKIAQHPDSFLLKENLVQYFRETGNYSKALAETNAYLQQDSTNDRLFDIQALLHFENGDTLSAITSYENAFVLNPRAEYLISLGSLYAQTRNPRALEAADGLLNAPHPTAAMQALFIKGLYYTYAGDKKRALGYFDTCLKMDYRNLLAYREKAICLYDLARYEPAIEVLTQALTVQKTFDEGYYWMGRCYEKLGKTKMAIENYQTALQLDPDYLEAKHALAALGISV